MTQSPAALSRFTPSLMPHELLERLFVAREQTLDSILLRIERAAESSERNHTLLVGPRGSGKTHLVSLVYHRTNERRAAGARVQVAWLPEDPWTIVSYRHLLAAVAERLEPKLDDPVPQSAEEIEAALSAAATERGPIVVLVENLDQILHALRNDGQQRLRHLLQAERPLLLVATSTRLDRALSDQASPFYGFFSTSRLKPFDVEEAATMLKAIADERDDEDLVEYLDSREGRARLRTITHLAGGQPRMWAALASALTVGGLDELVHLLLTRFDDLTPYYQEQLARLAPQQRLVVADLAGADHPVNVRELAERLDIDQRSLAKTMSELVDRGWAMPTSSPVTQRIDKRRTYYELAEPLARLSFQIKESRGEPLRLVVEFLKHWFDPVAFEKMQPVGPVAEYVLLAVEGHAHDPVVAVTRRLHRLPVTRAPAVALLGEIDDALGALMDDAPEPFLRLPAPVRAALEDDLQDAGVIGARFTVHSAARDEFGHTRHPNMAAWVVRAELIVAATEGDEKPVAQLALADWLGRAWRFEEAFEVLAAASQGDVSDRSVVSARAELAWSLWEAGRTEEAIGIEEAVLAETERILGPEHPDTLTARGNLAVSYRETGRTQEATSLEEAVLADRRRILGPEHPDTLIARGNLASSYRQAGRTEEALELAEAVVADIQRILGPEHQHALTARANLASLYSEAERTREAMELSEAVVTDSERILGPEHPHTLIARANLALYYREGGRTQEAIELSEAVVADCQRVLGSEHPETLLARANLAAFYWQVGRTEEALELEETALAARQRILGPEHPETLLARENLAASHRAQGRTPQTAAKENN